MEATPANRWWLSLNYSKSAWNEISAILCIIMNYHYTYYIIHWYFNFTESTNKVLLIDLTHKHIQWRIVLPSTFLLHIKWNSNDRIIVYEWFYDNQLTFTHYINTSMCKFKSVSTEIEALQPKYLKEVSHKILT